jgi:hypothetical protein
LERLAWARAHEVKLSANLTAELEAAANPSSLASISEPATATPECCSRRADEPCAEPSPADDSIVVVQALACHGQGGAWLACVVAVPVIATTWDYQPTARAHLPLPAPAFTSATAPPPVPPPRLAIS